MSKDSKPVLCTHIFLRSKGRETNFEKPCPRANGNKTSCGRKSNFSYPGLDSMFVTNRTAVGFKLKTTKTSSFENLYIHMFNFLNNSIAIWCVRITVSSWFFSLRRKILYNLKLHLFLKPGLSDWILIVDFILFLSLWSSVFFVILREISFINSKINSSFKSSPFFHIKAKLRVTALFLVNDCFLGIFGMFEGLKQSYVWVIQSQKASEKCLSR